MSNALPSIPEQINRYSKTKTKKMEKACENAKELCLKKEERINAILKELNVCGKSDRYFLKSIKTV